MRELAEPTLVLFDNKSDDTIKFWSWVDEMDGDGDASFAIRREYPCVVLNAEKLTQLRDAINVHLAKVAAYAAARAKVSP